MILGVALMWKQFDVSHHFSQFRYTGSRLRLSLLRCCLTSWQYENSYLRIRPSHDLWIIGLSKTTEMAELIWFFSLKNTCQDTAYGILWIYHALVFDHDLNNLQGTAENLEPSLCSSSRDRFFTNRSDHGPFSICYIKFCEAVFNGERCYIYVTSLLLSWDHKTRAESMEEDRLWDPLQWRFLAYNLNFNGNFALL